jgi:hypothetical protein
MAEGGVMSTRAVTLIFESASNPPDADTTVLIADVEDVYTGWFEGTDSDTKEQMWFDSTGKPVTDVRAWAHLPASEDCAP